MSAHIKKVLRPAAAIVTDTTTVSIAHLLHPHAQEITAIQHSPDGTNWFTLVAGAAQSSNGFVEITLASTVSHFQYVRASVLSSSVTSGATVTVNLWHGVQR